MPSKIGISLFAVVAIVILAVIIKQTTDIGQLIFEDALSRTQVGTLCLQFPDGKLKKFGENISNPGTDKDKTPCDNIMVLNKPKEFFDKLAFVGFKVGMGEAYMEGLWDVGGNGHLHDLYTQLIYNAFRFPPWYGHILEAISPSNLYLRFQGHFIFTHTKEKDMETITEHYNIGDDFYTWVLGDTVLYTTGLWARNFTTLREAQENKLNVLFKKLRVKPGHRVLDFGSGWGYAASKLVNETGAKVTGITLTSNQVAWSKNMFENPCVAAGNSNCPHFHQLDYRDAPPLGPFDRVLSLGSMEHVVMRNLDLYMKIMSEILVDEGIMVLQYTHENDLYPEFFSSDRAHACTTATFIHKYIFHGGCLLSPDWIAEAAAKHGFVEAHREQFGLSYVRTLRTWGDNLARHKKDVFEKYDETLYRMFAAYLAEAEGLFRTRAISKAQQVFVKEPKGIPLAGKKLNLDVWAKYYYHFGNNGE